MAGLHKHKWSYTVKYAPDHFGSNKWRPPNYEPTERWINLFQLGALAKSGNGIDLVALGYDKLLGQGTVSGPLKVKVNKASKSAIEKIKAAGGNVKVLEPPEEKKPPEKPQQPPQKSQGKGGKPVQK